MSTRLSAGRIERIDLRAKDSEAYGRVIKGVDPGDPTAGLHHARPPACLSKTGAAQGGDHDARLSGGAHAGANGACDPGRLRRRAHPGGRREPGRDGGSRAEARPAGARPPREPWVRRQPEIVLFAGARVGRGHRCAVAPRLSVRAESRSAADRTDPRRRRRHVVRVEVRRHGRSARRRHASVPLPRQPDHHLGAEPDARHALHRHAQRHARVHARMPGVAPVPSLLRGVRLRCRTVGRRRHVGPARRRGPHPDPVYEGVVVDIDPAVARLRVARHRVRSETGGRPRAAGQPLPAGLAPTEGHRA